MAKKTTKRGRKSAAAQVNGSAGAAESGNPFDAPADNPPTRPAAPAEPPATGAFPEKTCNRLRYLYGRREKWRRERVDAFTTRDAIRAELDELGKSEKEKRRQLEADFGQCVMEIERLNKSIKWAESECFTTIKDGDQGELFEDEAPKPPPSLFEHKAGKKSADQVGGESDGDEE